MDNTKINQCLQALDRIAAELRQMREMFLPYTQGYLPVMIPENLLEAIGVNPQGDAPVLLDFEQSGRKLVIRKKNEKRG